MNILKITMNILRFIMGVIGIILTTLGGLDLVSALILLINFSYDPEILLIQEQAIRSNCKTGAALIIIGTIIIIKTKIKVVIDESKKE